MLDVILKRKSVRNYLPGRLPEEMIRNMLEAARRAPSAGNAQPWFFYVVESDSHKKLLAVAAFNQQFLARAPVCIVVCAEPGRSGSYYGTRGKSLYCIQDTAAAAENILLAAAAMGLGACWVGAFDEDRVASALQIPGDRRPVAIISAGYPSVLRESAAPRRDFADITCFI